MLTRPPLTQVFIPVLEEHIVIMLIMLAGQPEARREGAPLPNCFPLLEQLVACRVPSQAAGRLRGRGRRGWGCGLPVSRAVESTWAVSREGLEELPRTSLLGKGISGGFPGACVQGWPLGVCERGEFSLMSFPMPLMVMASPLLSLPAYASPLFISSFLNLQAHNALLLVWNLLAGKFMI